MPAQGYTEVGFTDCHGRFAWRPALGHLSQFFTQIFAGFSEFEGTMELQTGGPMLTGVGIRYDNADGAVFTTTPVTKLP